MTLPSEASINRSLWAGRTAQSVEASRPLGFSLSPTFQGHQVWEWNIRTVDSEECLIDRRVHNQWWLQSEAESLIGREGKCLWVPQPVSCGAIKKPGRVPKCGIQETWVFSSNSDYWQCQRYSPTAVCLPCAKCFMRNTLLSPPRRTLTPHDSTK